MGRGRPPVPLERMASRSPDGMTPGHRHLPAIPQRRHDFSVPVPSIDLTGRGEVEWEKIWTAGWWLNRQQDYHWVEMICQAYMDIEVYRQRVNEDGLITKGYAGQDAAHPLIAEIRKCQATIQRCLSVLGFSPTDRAKLAIKEATATTALRKAIDESRRGTPADKMEERP